MNYLKGKKTKITKQLIQAQSAVDFLDGEKEIELWFHRDGDLDDILTAKWYDGDYLCLDTLNKQIEKEMNERPFEFVELCYPTVKGDFDHLKIWGEL
tara:strand:- start:1392 stop:1682 length:291 start_codon:yes stop_codon:yes gene_type:complete